MGVYWLVMDVQGDIVDIARHPRVSLWARNVSKPCATPPRPAISTPSDRAAFYRGHAYDQRVVMPSPAPG